METHQLERASWSVGPFFASPVLIAGLEMASVTIAELVAETPLGMGTVAVTSASPLGLRLLKAFPTGTTVSRTGQSFALNAPMGEHGSQYIEADQLPFLEVTRHPLPETLIDALAGRPLSCLLQASLLPLRAIDPVIADATLILRSRIPILRVSLIMDWIQSPDV